MKKYILFGLVLILLTSFASADLTTDNQMYWSFDDSNAIDSSINGNNGTIDGATYTASGLINGAYSFDGTNDKITILEPSTSSSGTINVWFYEDSYISSATLLDYRIGASLSGYIEAVSVSAGTFRIYTNGGTLTFTETYTTGTWTMLTLTQTGSSIKGYLNGIYAGTMASSNWLDDTTGGTFNLGTNGYYAGGTTYHFNGKTDEVGIWDRALNITEILELYNSNIGYNPYETIPPTPDTINITDIKPINNTYLTTINTDLNTTIKSKYDFTVKLYIDSTLNETSIQTAGTKTINFNKDVTRGSHTYYFYTFQTNDTTQNETSSTNTFIVDTVYPTEVNNINNSNFTNTINYNLTLTDSNLDYFMINDSCGFNFHNDSMINPYNYLSKQDIKSCSLGEQQTNITVCDLGGLCIDKVFIWHNKARVNITAKNIISGSVLNTFSIYVDGILDGSTTNGYYHIDNLDDNVKYNIKINYTNFQILSFNYTVNTSYYDYQFKLYEAQSFNFTFKDEKTNEILSGVDISIEFISPTSVYNYTTNTGLFYVSLLTPEDYAIRYFADGYGRKRHKYYTLTTQSHTNMVLYLINSSETVTATVYNELTLDKVPSAIVYLQRYFHDENVYRTVAEYQTDVSGVAYFDVETQTEYYKWLVDYPWQTRKLETDEEYIEGTTINLYISTTDTVGEAYYNEESIQYSLSYIEASNEFGVTYTDASLIASEYCLYIIKYGRYHKEIVNSTCSSSSSATINIGGMDENITYYALFTADIDGDVRNIATAFVEIGEDKLNSGAYGVFLTLILVLILVFVSQLHIFSLILGTSGLLFAKLIGILNLGWGYIISVFIASIILAIMIEMRK